MLVAFITLKKDKVQYKKKIKLLANFHQEEQLCINKIKTIIIFFLLNFSKFNIKVLF